MINKHVQPISERIEKYGRLCDKCWNCNDHIVEYRKKKTEDRIKCPECGKKSKWRVIPWLEVSGGKVTNYKGETFFVDNNGKKI